MTEHNATDNAFSHRAAGRNNEKALNDIIRATLSWRKAAQDAGKSQDEQNQITEQGLSFLEENKPEFPGGFGPFGGHAWQ